MMPKWTTKDKPKSDDTYIVTLSRDEDTWCDFAEYNPEKKRWYIPIGSRVVAWMPMPEPYNDSTDQGRDNGKTETV